MYFATWSILWIYRTEFSRENLNGVRSPQTESDPTEGPIETGMDNPVGLSHRLNAIERPRVLTSTLSWRVGATYLEPSSSAFTN